MEEIEERKDYYEALKLTPKATAEELKASYINLALHCHPDSAITGNKSPEEVQQLQAEFVKISEAWRILSRPHLKASYDYKRRNYLIRSTADVNGVDYSSNRSPMGNSSYNMATSEELQHISVELQSHRESYAKVQGRAASDLPQEKYKSERWQQMPLNQRKINRGQSMMGFGTILVRVIIPLASFSAFAYMSIS